MAQSREINLIPYDVLVRDLVRERIWMWAVIIPLVIIVLSGFYVSEKKKIGAVEGVIAGLSLKKLEMERKLKQLSIFNDRRDTLSRKEQVINSLLNKRPLSLIFAELENAMSNRIWLTSFEFKDGLSLSQGGHGRDSDKWVDTGYMIVRKAGPAEKKNSDSNTIGVTAMMHGIADSNKDVAGFLEQLSDSVIFSEVNLMFLREETIDKQSVVEFKIETYLENM